MSDRSAVSNTVAQSSRGTPRRPETRFDLDERLDRAVESRERAQALEIVDGDDCAEIRNLARHVGRRRGVEQDRSIDALVPDLAHVVRIADGERIGAALDGRAPRPTRPAAESVALDDGEDPDLGTDPPPDKADVVLERPEIDLDPRRAAAGSTPFPPRRRQRHCGPDTAARRIRVASRSTASGSPVRTTP